MPYLIPRIIEYIEDVNVQVKEKELRCQTEHLDEWSDSLEELFYGNGFVGSFNERVGKPISKGLNICGCD